MTTTPFDPNTEPEDVQPGVTPDPEHEADETNEAPGPDLDAQTNISQPDPLAAPENQED